MLRLVQRTHRVILVGSALAFAAFAGWGSFAYTAVGYDQQASVLTAERDSALAAKQRLQATVGELSEVEARLGSARLEYNRVVQSWADAKGRVVATQQELAQLAKRVDQAKDRVNQTGSIKPAEPPRRPAR